MAAAKKPAKTSTKTPAVKKKAVAKAAAKPAPKKVTAETPVSPVPVVSKTSNTQTPKGEFFYASGNRKTSVARVRLYKGGNGEITVNGKKLEDFIGVPSKRDSIKAPLRITGQSKTFNVSIKTSGGGLGGQADAIRHGIAKALLEFDPSLRVTLKRAGFLTRDPRMKERKKYGLHRARRAPQWSKR
jgi:small subunit ribosomal protein S9